jgi:presequence protease
MTTTHGFELVREQMIPELNTQAHIYRHVKTGAELLSMVNDDENKVFGITFRTPPADSTGIAHILEHAVLGGSQKYPLREPFVQLIKGSLKTFLNAMTSADRTMYPVASTNLQDFYNLVEVYLDAVFHPLITPYHLYQEGWYYELDGPDAPLRYKGVVFNEMKGVYSSPDSLLFRTSLQSLFPDNAYGLDSGGDPKVIPQLTYEQFKTFHSTFYHPSNAMIYFYGDDAPEERMRILDEYLCHYEAANIDAGVPLQPPFDQPRRLTRPYGIDPNANSSNGAGNKAMVQVNWLLPEGTDPALVMALSILSYALVSTQASPLRKALIDSGLGEDLTGGGLGNWLRQMIFSAGLKGVQPADADKVEALILEKLEKLAEQGIEPDMIEAALNTIEFSLRENNTGSYPRGLSLMSRALHTWTYGGDPLASLFFEAPLAEVRARLSQNPAYLQDLIRTYLLDNTHRTTVVLTPDPDLNRREEAEEEARLAKARAGLSEADLQTIIETTRELKRLQETPDSPEALAKLPTLTLADLERQIKTIPLELSELHGSRLLFHDLFTNGIVYLDLGLNLHSVPENLLPYAKLFSQSLIEMGTETEDFVKLSQRIGRKTGGIYPSSFLSDMRETEDGTAWIFLHGKATVAQAQEMLAILRDILLTVKLDNPNRFRQIVLKAKARSESSLVPSGHSVVDGRLRAGFTKANWASEQMGGISYLFFLRQLTDAIDNDWPGVLAKLEEVRRRLVNRSGMICNVTLDTDNWVKFQPQLEEFLVSLPAGAPQLPGWTPSLELTNEGLAIPAQVNYVGKGADLYALGYRLHGSISVITNYLRTSWLWEKVRVQGGAYGGFCRFSQQSGILSYLSYRDPNLLGTLDVYDRTADFLRNVELSQDELTKNIIGAIGTLDAYQLPDAKGYTSMVRYLLNETDERRQQFRDEVLGATVADFRAFADVLDEVRRHGRVVVMGSKDVLDKANVAQGNGWLSIQQVL